MGLIKMKEKELITESELSALTGKSVTLLTMYRKERKAKKKMKDGTIKEYIYQPIFKKNIDYIWDKRRVCYYKEQALKTLKDYEEK